MGLGKGMRYEGLELRDERIVMKDEGQMVRD